MEKEWEALDTIYDKMTIECSELIDRLYLKGNTADYFVMKELQNRIKVIHHKAESVLEFIKILKAAEAVNCNLGYEINSSVGYYYTDLIIDLHLDIDYENVHYLADMKCADFFKRWRIQCVLYPNNQ